MRRREDGFTLIELLIVIVILGILAAIVVFAVGNTGKDSAKSACQSDAKTLETAQEAYYAEHHNAYAADASALLAAKYIKELPGGSHYSMDTDNTGAINVTINGNTVDYVADKTACDAAT